MRQRGGCGTGAGLGPGAGGVEPLRAYLVFPVSVDILMGGKVQGRPVGSFCDLAAAVSTGHPVTWKLPVVGDSASVRSPVRGCAV